jgi:hypothetical protein
MQIIRSLGDADAVDPELRQLISEVFARTDDCPEILGYVLLVEPGDTIANIDAILRFSILAGRHEFIVEHAGYFELVYVLGQDGSGLVVFVPKTEGPNPELLTMCIEQAIPPETMQ